MIFMIGVLSKLAGLKGCPVKSHNSLPTTMGHSRNFLYPPCPPLYFVKIKPRIFHVKFKICSEFYWIFEKVLEIPSFFLIFEKMPRKFRFFSSLSRKCLGNFRFFKIISSQEVQCCLPPIFGQNLESNNGRIVCKNSAQKKFKEN